MNVGPLKLGRVGEKLGGHEEGSAIVGEVGELE